MTNREDADGLAARKAELRIEALAARAGLPGAAATGPAVVRHFIASPWNSALPGRVAAGYWPVRGEIDCRPLLSYLRESDVRTVLPVVETPQAPLNFRLWEGGEPAARDLVNMAVPDPGAPTLRPEIVFVPLLLVDRIGHRLGYGGGYYDRTLKELKRTGTVIALGLAFDAQLTDKLPASSDDMTLDGVITEKKWLWFEDGHSG